MAGEGERKKRERPWRDERDGRLSVREGRKKKRGGQPGGQRFKSERRSKRRRR